jgi:hypothetical protein
MNRLPFSNKSKADSEFVEDEVFDDSSFLAKFEDTSFKETRVSKSIINDSINKSDLNVR